MKQLLLILILLGAGPVLNGRADEDAGAALSVAEAAAYLREEGLKTERTAAERAALEALIKAADPGGKVMTETDILAYMNAKTPARRHPGLLAGRSTNQWPVAAQWLGPEAEAPMPADSHWQTLNGLPLEEVRPAALNEYLLALTNQTCTAVFSREGRIQTARWEQVDCDLPTVIAHDVFRDDFHYLRVFGFYSDTDRSLVEAVDQAIQDDAGGLIVDLREAGGRSLKTIADFMELFTAPGSLMFKLENLQGRELNMFESATPARAGDLPVVILCNRQTIGAAELLAGVFPDSYPHSLLIGTPGQGDMMVRTLHRLESGLAIYVANRRIITAAGQTFGGGAELQPDILIEDAGTPIYSSMRVTRPAGQQPPPLEDDRALTRALDILQGIHAMRKDAM